MKIAIISDIHQTIYWRKLIDQVNDFDKIIFLGDEFDYWKNKWPLQMDNAENIIAFKKSNPDKIDLCWSNHATSYYLDEQCSGYQRERAVDIKEFYTKYKDLYNVIYIYDNWIFSHGGISAKWMKYCRINNLSEINLLFKERPNFFRWVGPDGYGNNSNEGPLWIRIEALITNYVQGFNQAVGHTENDQPRIVKKYKQLFVFCDTHDHNYLTVIDTGTNAVEFVNLK
ncbi:MAG: metallophosphoesterase [Treponema sp.]|nr:metallophosphoesterase [Treponema sp.]